MPPRYTVSHLAIGPPANIYHCLGKNLGVPVTVPGYGAVYDIRGERAL
jgi:hypothetical protein